MLARGLAHVNARFVNLVRYMALVALVVIPATVPGCARNERAAPAAEESTAVPRVVLADTAEYIVRGNEPFWAVNVTREAIVFLEPERQEGVRGAYAPPDGQGGALVFRTVLRDTVDIPLELRLEERPCSDGMSDHAYTHAAVARVGNRVLEGCAERRSATADSARRY